MRGLSVLAASTTKSMLKTRAKTKKWKEGNSLGLPLVDYVFGYLAAVAWSYLDFPAAEFFDFAAYS